jgi:DNA-binding LytR/AlgR family response regulator
MEVIIVEDEQMASGHLVEMLGKIDPDIRVKAVLETITDAVQWFKSNTADLVFMDIHLADGSSFSIFDQVQVAIPVIFTTAYDQYAIKAFKVNSVDYLLKPFSIEELEQALSKYKQYNRFAPQNQLDIQSIKHALGIRNEYKKRFMVYYGDKIRSIKTENIAYFFFEDRTTFLSTMDKSVFAIDYSLDKIEQEVDPEQFFRINRQMIVNFDAIDNMVNLSKSRMGLHLKPVYEGNALVSFNKMSRFRKWINR